MQGLWTGPDHSEPVRAVVWRDVTCVASSRQGASGLSARGVSSIFSLRWSIVVGRLKRADDIYFRVLKSKFFHINIKSELGTRQTSSKCQSGF